MIIINLILSPVLTYCCLLCWAWLTCSTKNAVRPASWSHGLLGELLLAVHQRGFWHTWEFLWDPVRQKLEQQRWVREIPLLLRWVPSLPYSSWSSATAPSEPEPLLVLAGDFLLLLSRFTLNLILNTWSGSDGSWSRTRLIKPCSTG